MQEFRVYICVYANVCMQMCMSLTYLLPLKNVYSLHEAGSRYLCYLLKKCNTITSLYLDGNHFGDDATAEVLSCFKKPGMQFIDPSSAASETVSNK